MSSKKNLKNEPGKLKNLPPIPKEEQGIIDIIAGAMADRSLKDLALGIHQKPYRKKKQ